MHFFLKHYFRVVASGKKKSKSLHNKLPHLIEDTSRGREQFLDRREYVSKKTRL